MSNKLVEHKESKEILTGNQKKILFWICFIILSIAFITVWINILLTSKAFNTQMEEMVLGEDYYMEDIVITGKRAEAASISDTGLAGHYGAEVGATLRGMFQEGPFEMRAAAAAAAGSDARMNGCPLPVVINSGSGNQGLTITMPVLLYAEENQVDHDSLLRALAIANLMSIHQKRFIGSLSAYCGATSAACAAAVGICWLQGGSYEQICGVITNTLATLGGMWCDGAKSSCASKIAAAVYTGLLSVRMSMNGHRFEQGEGIVTASVEKTIQDVGHIAREGMREADLEILRLMLKN